MKQTLWLAVPAVLLLTLGGCVAPAVPPPAAVTAPPAPPAPAAIVAVTPPPAALTEVVPVAPAVPEVVAAVPAATVTAPPAAPTAEAKGPQPAPPAVTKPAPPKPAATPAVAKAPAAPAKPLIFEASFGRVTFDHPRHAASHPCTSCHATQPPGKFALGKEKAHQLCKGCHQQKGVPTQCTACHKKG